MRPLTCSARISARHKQRSLLSFVLLICFAVVPLAIYAQSTTPQEKPMQRYALLFYPTRTLTPEEQSRRAAEILVWARQVTDMGITLDPRAFGETVATLSASSAETISPNGSAPSPALTNIVFFDSPSKDETVKIARMHPGLHYGVIVDVREWTTPRPVAATPAR